MADKVQGAKAQIHSAAALAALNGTLKTKPGVTERSARAVRLKNELNVMLELIVKMRERLENELADSAQQKFIDKNFIDKVNKLAQSFERLTASRIQLDKAEKSLEAEMSPAEEMAAVRTFILEGLDNTERAKFLWKLNESHKKLTGGVWPPEKDPTTNE